MKKRLMTVLFACALGLTSCGSGDSETTTAAADSGDQGSAEGALGSGGNDDDGDELAESAEEESASPDDADDAGSGLNDGEQAIADAIVAVQEGSLDEVYTPAAVQCYAEQFVANFGVERLNSYGITLDNPDDSLVPNEYEPQVLVVDSLKGCFDVGPLYASEIEGCSLDSIPEEDLFLAIRHSFLLSFPEYDQSEGEAAMAAVEPGLATCLEDQVAEG